MAKRFLPGTFDTSAFWNIGILAILRRRHSKPSPLSFLRVTAFLTPDSVVGLYAVRFDIGGRRFSCIQSIVPTDPNAVHAKLGALISSGAVLQQVSTWKCWRFCRFGARVADRSQMAMEVVPAVDVGTGAVAGAG